MSWRLFEDSEAEKTEDCYFVGYAVLGAMSRVIAVAIIISFLRWAKRS